MPSSHVPSHPEKDVRRGPRRPRKLVHSLPVELVERFEGHLATFAQHMREGLLAASTAVGLEVFEEMMGSEVEALVGPEVNISPVEPPIAMAASGLGHPGRPPPGGSTASSSQRRWRGGTASGELRGCQRHRSSGRGHSRPACSPGLSTRNYGAGLEPVGEAIEERAVSTSHAAVSRRFVTATAERLSELLGRRLDDRRYLVLMLDGWVRHEAPHDRVGWKGPPPGCRSSPVKLGAA